MKDSIRALAELVSDSSRIVGFTGAGVSTESGISDYRSKGGLWNRFTPVYYREFLDDGEKRKLYWQRKLEMWPSLRDAEPNAGHRFFAQLHERGKLDGLITQNVDGLHERAGVPREKIVRIHGTNSEIVCLKCRRILPAADVMESLKPEDPPPRCGECGGLLKPNTISFGQSLEPRELQRAEELASDCDCMLSFGSTLVVYPAAEFPASAARRGARLAIVTLSETPLDDTAEVVIHRPIGEVVGELTRELGW
jgi:NAD-dependent deacetylase